MLARQYQDFYGPYNISGTLYRDSSLHIDADIDDPKIGFHLRARYRRGQKDTNLFEICPYYTFWHTEVSKGPALANYRYFILDDSKSSLVILRDDEVAFSGTFSFNALCEEIGDTFHITQGRFDIKNRD